MWTKHQIALDLASEEAMYGIAEARTRDVEDAMTRAVRRAARSVTTPEDWNLDETEAALSRVSGDLEWAVRSSLGGVLP